MTPNKLVVYFVADMVLADMVVADIDFPCGRYGFLLWSISSCCGRYSCGRYGRTPLLFTIIVRFVDDAIVEQEAGQLIFLFDAHIWLICLPAQHNATASRRKAHILVCVQ